MNKMFCNQCEEFFTPDGCTVSVVCGKHSELSDLQDLFILKLQELSYHTHRIRQVGIEYQEFNRFICHGLFMTLTNTNFDEDRFIVQIQKCVYHLDKAASVLSRFAEEPLPETRTGELPDEPSIRRAARELPRARPSERRSVYRTVLYGLKGIAAYTEQANRMDFQDPEIHAFLQKALAFGREPSLALDELYELMDECGRMGLRALSLLDKAHGSRYGEPMPARVSTDVGNRPAILVSGHDLRDLEEVLQLTEGSGIDVYTHGEMLPAHAYPFFRRFSHLAGNYGGSWWRQAHEFASFNGPVLVTTDCLMPPGGPTPAKVFTTGAVGYPGYPHIEGFAVKDYTPLLAAARESLPPRRIECGELTVGYAHDRLTELVPLITEKLREGTIRKIIVMAGCDGRRNDREYYTEFASLLPEDTLILTAGCAKYRYNKLPLGTIDGIPRVVDAGQCNDVFSIVLFLRRLALELNTDELPVVFNLAWYEQKSVLIILSLLSLGFKNLTIGPRLPAFFSHEMMSRLVSRYGLSGISSVKNDLFYMVGEVKEYVLQ